MTITISAKNARGRSNKPFALFSLLLCFELIMTPSITIHTGWR
jgi:hypothetical protein